MKTILAPLDFSEVTPRVIDATLDLAKELSAEVRLLYVVPPPIPMSGYGFGEAHISDQSIREQKEAERKLNRYRDQMQAAGVSARVLTMHGPPIESILLVGREEGADFVVIGSHGHGAFYEFIVGSTTRGILREFPGPVVIITSHPAEHQDRAAS